MPTVTIEVTETSSYLSFNSYFIKGKVYHRQVDVFGAHDGFATLYVS